ncbi:hypothetical protein [Neptuniibacter sp.]|uniref:hypothetical protein n=1 Tax=Neptuniibacter sp. TaxID=1962643 RepID=UPI003B596347
MKGVSGQEAGANNAQKVREWVAERDLYEDYMEYRNEVNGEYKINRSTLVAELDFSRSVVNQNRTVKDLLAEAELRWYGVKEESSEAHKAARERSEKKTAKRTADVSKLEDELAKLKAENAELRKQLRRFEAMDEIIQKSGMAPRL